MSANTNSGVADVVLDIVADLEAIDRLGYDEIAEAAKGWGDGSLMHIATRTTSEVIRFGDANGVVITERFALEAIETWSILNGHGDAAKHFISMVTSHKQSLDHFQRWVRDESWLEPDYRLELIVRTQALSEQTGRVIAFGRVFAAKLGATLDRPADEWVFVEIAHMKFTHKTAGDWAKDDAKPWFRRASRGKYECQKSHLREVVSAHHWPKYGIE